MPNENMNYKRRCPSCMANSRVLCILHITVEIVNAESNYITHHECHQQIILGVAFK